jgi:hypothetical protein
MYHFDSRGRRLHPSDKQHLSCSMLMLVATGTAGFPTPEPRLSFVVSVVSSSYFRTFVL